MQLNRTARFLVGLIIAVHLFGCASKSEGTDPSITNDEACIPPSNNIPRCAPGPMVLPAEPDTPQETSNVTIPPASVVALHGFTARDPRSPGVRVSTEGPRSWTSIGPDG